MELEEDQEGAVVWSRTVAVGWWSRRSRCSSRRRDWWRGNTGSTLGLSPCRHASTCSVGEDKNSVPRRIETGCKCDPEKFK